VLEYRGNAARVIRFIALIIKQNAERINSSAVTPIRWNVERGRQSGGSPPPVIELYAFEVWFWREPSRDVCSAPPEGVDVEEEKRDESGLLVLLVFAPVLLNWFNVFEKESIRSREN
jgi:hypothetical protein